MHKGSGQAFEFHHGTLLPCIAQDGTGQGLGSLSILSGLWVAGLDPSGRVAGGQSTTKDPAIPLDADTQV